MKKKSSKQKCLEMWEWLQDNPDKGKYEYQVFLQEQNREQEFAPCWACSEARKRSDSPGICDACPLAFPSPDGYRDCLETGSPYNAWNVATSIKATKAAAAEMVELIKTTWEG